MRIGKGGGMLIMEPPLPVADHGFLKGGGGLNGEIGRAHV